MSGAFDIGGRQIGDGASCYVIAEVGVNHNGDESMAHRLVDVAAEVGADAVKFQTFDPSQLASADAAPAPYQVRTAAATTQLDMLQALVLRPEAWAELADHASQRGLTFLSAAFDRPSLAILQELDVPAYKLGSGELTNLPFIRDVAASGRPLILSTGMATNDEIAQALEAAAAAPTVCLLHCVTAYPTPAADSNLRAIPAMQERFSVPVGWSDHTEGIVTGVAAVALGAALLEKHLTLDRSLPGPDHEASADPDTFAAYMQAVREAESALGDGEKRPMPSELENRVHARRSLHTARALRAGQPIEAEDVAVLRPATGLSPAVPLTGLRARHDLEAGVPLTEEDVTRETEPADGAG